MEKYAVIPLETANAIGQYLLTKPMNEVENLVNALRGAEIIEKEQIKDKGEN